MTDNTTLPGTGETYAADDCAGVKYQEVKLVDGTADSTARIPGDATYGLDVDVTRLPALPAGTNTVGKVQIAESGATMLYTKVALSASQTAATVLDPTAGKKWVLRKLVLSGKTAGDVYFFDSTDDAAHAVGPAFTLAIGSNTSINWDADAPRRSAAVDNILKYTSGSGITGSVYLCYFEE